MAHLYCPECGYNNPESAHFCAKCGAALVVPEEGEKTESFIAPEVPESLDPLEDLGVHGAALIVSQFTLFADLSRGRRPSLLGAGDPKRAEELYLAFVQRFREREIETKTGSFGAVMSVAIENDGPVTLVLSSGEWPTSV